MHRTETYPIGTPGEKWGTAERKLWLSQQTVKRSYQREVLDKIKQLSSELEIEQYSALEYDLARYPLLAVKTRNWDVGKPTALVTGGVHGYETSGVQGAIRFLETEVISFAKDFNIVVAPCISPWAYETINRWNPHAVDPNRSFTSDSPSQESAELMKYIDSLKAAITLHIDLHETTDTDNTEFRPALAARDNVEHEIWDIPDGFYLVGDTDDPADEFQAHIIDAVSKVTHIAVADGEGKIIGEAITQFGVINYPTRKLGLCTGFSDSRFCTTTEVYPDSPKVDDENCIQAQVAAISSALNFIATHS